jgi:peptidyl-prolyl cis-trans isomerase A (cyclophilin A)
MNKSVLIFVLFASVFLISGKHKEISQDVISIKSPEKFNVKFETTKGDFEVTIERKNSPLAADRFYQLVKTEYFTNVLLYRCVPNFVVQFGSLDEELDSLWSKHIILDEPVKLSNDTGTIAFARAGKNSRGTQLFINLKNNSRLDTVSYGETLGFPAFGFVRKGMENVYKLFNEYGDEPRKKLENLKENPEEFIKKNYPKLDYIKKAYLIN